MKDYKVMFKVERINSELHGQVYCIESFNGKRLGFIGKDEHGPFWNFYAEGWGAFRKNELIGITQWMEELKSD